MSISNDFVSLIDKNPWQNDANLIWLASTLKLFRNVDRYPFPGKLELQQQKILLELISKTFVNNTLLVQPQFLRADNVTSAQKQFLFEHFLCQDAFQEAHANEGFIIDNTGVFFASVHMHDHVQMQLVDTSGALETAWNRLVKIEMEAGKNLDYSFSSRFGFLTASPEHCGTGFVAFLYLHVPAIIHSNQLFAILDKELEEGIISAGIQGGTNEFIGDILTLHNYDSIGVSEEEILRKLQTAATKITLAEKSLRTHLQGHDESVIKNKVSRAFGLAFHSYQLETVEALSALSLCKLGVDLGWIKGIDQTLLNKLLFTCKRGHLMALYNLSDPEELAKKRALLLHEAFKPTQLLI